MREWDVLIVEDDARVAAVHRRIVDAQPGFRVTVVATTGEEALALFKRGVSVDLMLLDVGLPGMDGATLLRVLRAGGSRPEVIAITAARERAVVQAMLHLGVIDYLLKPFTMERLQQALVRFRDRMRRLQSDQLEQDAIDEVWKRDSTRLRLPKGLKPETLELVRGTLRRADDALTADAVARETAVARVTARRYLEYLVTVGEVGCDQLHAGPGRPRKLYRWQPS